MLVNLEDVWEFEDESSSFVLFEADTASEEVEARDGEGLVDLGENEVLELEYFAGFLLDFHVVIEAMVTDTLDFFGDGGGLGHGSGGSEI